jgi:hypothetical protein
MAALTFLYSAYQISTQRLCGSASSAALRNTPRQRYPVHAVRVYMSTGTNIETSNRSCNYRRLRWDSADRTLRLTYPIRSGVRLSPLGTSATIWPTAPEYRAVGGMRIGRGSRSTQRKPAPDLGSNQATNHLSYGTASSYKYTKDNEYLGLTNVLAHADDHITIQVKQRR